MTGISSGVVTTTTPVIAGSWRMSSIQLGLVADEPDLDQVADHLRGTDLGDDVTGRLGVDHDEVVRALAHLVAQLADAEDLLDPRRRVGDEVERAGERADASEQRDLHEQPEVLAQRVLGVHRHREQVRFDLAGLELQRRGVEGVGERALGVHLAHERAAAGAGGELGDAPPRSTSCRHLPCP